MDDEGFRWRGRTIRRAAVIGSGNIGPDIALHLVKTLASCGARVLVLDISEAALASGRRKMFAKIEKGQRSGAFRAGRADAMRAAVDFDADYDRLRDADLVIEAASEDLRVKHRIFAAAEERVSADAVLLSNSSHLPPSELFSGLREPGRAAVAHYFFPAERNPVVELAAAPGAPALVPWLLGFYEEIGKVPLLVANRFGHALNPIFEGLFLAAALAVEEGLGTTREVDDVARRTLRLGIGPFTAMNLTGGNPIAAEGFPEMGARLHPWFRTPALLRAAVEDPGGRVWDVPGRGEKIEVEPDREQAIADRMTAAYTGLAAWTAAEHAISVPDLDLGCHLALAAVRPFGLMRRLGAARVRALVGSFRDREPAFFDPDPCLAEIETWTGRPVSRIRREDADGVRVLVIRRPEALGALDQDLLAELEEAFGEAEADPRILGVVLTGFGVKAFVAGADVRMLARITSPADGERVSRASHRVLDRIAAFPKPVVCALNGMAVGGGNELAMACHLRIAREGLAVVASQPEPNLGIIPGAGATQRLPRLVGIAAAWDLLRSARQVSAAEALELGLVEELVPGERLRPRAVERVREAAAGAPLPRPPSGPLPAPGDLPDIEIGHRSRAVDALVRRAVLEGAKGDLRDGLEIEIRLFAKGCALEDMRIGIRNFLENGPRAPAAFVHR